MNFTAIEKILMNHSVEPLSKVEPGDIVTARLDYAGIHEGFDARKWELFTDLGEMKGVFDKDKCGIYLGHHFCAVHSDELAENYKLTRDFGKKVGVKVYDIGTGIAHIQIMEQGQVYPGALAVFGDSHTPAYGAVGAMSCQCGVEMPMVWLTGQLWFKVPKSHKYIIEGQTKPGVYARDVIQHIVTAVGMDASVYCNIEFDGDYIHSLPVELRFPFTLMATELGAKCAFIEPDQITLDWVKPRLKPGTVMIPVKSDPGANFEKVFRFDVSKLEPQICFPPAPDKTHPIQDGVGIRVDQICIGTCTGGSIYDFREAAKVMKGREVQAKTLIVPATREVYKQCEKEGLLATFLDAGCEIYPAYCGTCQALSIGHIAPGETQMHCGPRNWPGRLAEGTSTYLGSAATCAATAVEGRIADPRKYL